MCSLCVPMSPVHREHSPALYPCFALFLVLMQMLPFPTVPMLREHTATPVGPRLSTGIPLKEGCKKEESQFTLLCCSKSTAAGWKVINSLTFSLNCFSSVLQSHLDEHPPWTPAETFKERKDMPSCPASQP